MPTMLTRTTDIQKRVFQKPTTPKPPTPTDTTYGQRLPASAGIPLVTWTHHLNKRSDTQHTQNLTIQDDNANNRRPPR